MKEAVSQVSTHSDELARPDAWTFGERRNMSMKRGGAPRNANVSAWLER